MTARPRLAVFDCDGTLVDSLGSIHGAMAAAFAAADLIAPARAAVGDVVGLSLLDAMARLAPGRGQDDYREMTAAYRKAFAANRAAGELDEPLYPGAREVLAALADDDWLLGVATGKSRSGLDHVLDGHGLGGLFVTLQTADVAAGKPSPEMLERAMSETGAAPADTVMIGDTSFDMEMAINAGTHAIGVSWGYHDVADLTAAGAHAIVSAYDELPGTIGRLIGIP